MFKGLGQIANLPAMLKQAQQVTGQMQGLNEKLKQQKATGSSGGGMVEVEVNGVGEVLAVRIDPALIERGEREMIEDLLPAAFNQAHAKSKQLHAEAVKSITEGMDFPGLDEAMSKMMGEDSAR